MTNLSRTSKRFGATGTLAAHCAIMLACFFVASHANPTPLPPAVEAVRITLSEPTIAPSVMPVKETPPPPEPPVEPEPPKEEAPVVKKIPEKTKTTELRRPKQTKPRKPAEQAEAPPQLAAQAEPRLKVPDAAVRDEARQTLLSALIARIEREKRYPTAARRLGLEGQIIVIVKVDAQGRIISVQTQNKQNLHGVLEKATIEALQRVRDGWSPIPVSEPMTLNIPIRYTLKSS